MQEQMKKQKSTRGYFRQPPRPPGPEHATLHQAQPNILLFLWCLLCNFCKGLNKISEFDWFCWENAERSSLSESEGLFFLFLVSSSAFYNVFLCQVK